MLSHKQIHGVREYSGWPNPSLDTALTRLRRQRALRRARFCPDVPAGQKVAELVAAGFSPRQAADVVACGEVDDETR